jgi:hypothetical protein
VLAVTGAGAGAGAEEIGVDDDPNNPRMSSIVERCDEGAGVAAEAAGVLDALDPKISANKS